MFDRLAPPAPPVGSGHSTEYTSQVYVDVLVPRRFRHAFTYILPPSLRSAVQVGTQVEIPFGRTRLHGVVIGFPATIPQSSSSSLKQISRVLDEDSAVPRELLELSHVVSDHYLAPWGQCLRLIVPPILDDTRVVRYRLTEEGRAALAKPGRTSKARAVLSRLAAVPRGLSAATLAHDVPGRLDQTLADLVKKRSIEALESKPRVRTVSAAPPPTAQPVLLKAIPPLPATSWWNDFQGALDRKEPTSFLVEGPAAARLTPILQACEATLARHRSAIIVAPEIARVSSISALAKARWGEHVAELHGGLSQKTRSAAWHRIRTGHATVVVGTRTAVFAPLAAESPGPVGLLCVDGEEDPSLKEEQEPHYHARDVARLRAEQQRAVLLLTSAHPSLETLTTVAPSAHTVLPRASGTPPPVQVLDQRETFGDVVLSPPLVDAMRSSLQASTGTVLYLNRKGFASALFCRDCGAVSQCPHCSVALRYYSGGGTSSPGRPTTGIGSSHLRCLYCGKSVAVYDTCPTCQSSRLQPIGFGTARLEEEVRRRFPQARIGRLDADTTHKPDEAARLWRTATVGGFDVLIGTQMLFQGPPLPAVGLVGIPHADAGLHVADFRSAERTYHGLLDATHLARSAEDGGMVIVQTYLPTHHAIVAVQHRQPALFYESELAFRKATAYPPFATLINLRVSGGSEPLVRQAAERWATHLLSGDGGRPGDRLGGVGSVGGVLVLGPVPAPVSRIRGRYRWQLLVKSSDGIAARQRVQATLEPIEAASSRDLKFEVDVDPTDLI